MSRDGGRAQGAARIQNEWAQSRAAGMKVKGKRAAARIRLRASGRGRRAPRIGVAAQVRLRLHLNHDVSTLGGAAAAVPARPLLLFLPTGRSGCQTFRSVAQTVRRPRRRAHCARLWDTQSSFPGKASAAFPPPASWQGLESRRWRPPPPSGTQPDLLSRRACRMPERGTTGTI